MTQTNDWEKEFDRLQLGMIDNSYGTFDNPTPFRSFIRTLLNTKDAECLCKDKGVIELIEESKAHWLRSEIEKLEGEMKNERNMKKGEYELETTGEVYAWNYALTSIITRYKEELLELEKGV